MANEKKSPYEKRKERFSSVTSLRAALNRVAKPTFQHDMYQHYTTLSNVLLKISSGKWWLSCCTSDRLNDQNEAIKYGNRIEARRLYQTCFCHGAAESVAMWGLYQCSKPCAVRISLTKDSLHKWMDALTAHIERNGKKYENVLFRDLVYLSVANPERNGDKYDIRRAEALTWEGVSTKKIENLQDEIGNTWATGLVKDYEWRHECESRLLVKVQKNAGRGIAVPIPDEVLDDMRFTFSPWLSPNMEALSERLITDALKKRLKTEPKHLTQRFRRSVVAGGLCLGDGRVPCAFCDECKLFGRYECRI